MTDETLYVVECDDYRTTRMTRERAERRAAEWNSDECPFCCLHHRVVEWTGQPSGSLLEGFSDDD